MSKSSAIEAIFARLTVVYGRDFTDRYASVEPAAVRADWARELGGFLERHAAIQYALDHLPPAKPPTSIEFRLLCNRAPTVAPLALPAPLASPTVVAAVRQSFTRAVVDPLAWAQRLRSREEAGEHLTATQREAWRTALRKEVVNVA